jgi:hypothetical protein
VSASSARGLRYVTSATGLGIYDVSRPEDPQRLRRLPLPH